MGSEKKEEIIKCYTFLYYEIDGIPSARADH
jgi:hypothetical protein